jgi:hypothetical protein
MFKNLPTEKQLKQILKKMSYSMGLKNYKINQIFTKSSLKHLNIELEFYLLKSILSDYYYNDIIPDKFELDSIECIFDVYNDFFGLDNKFISEIRFIPQYIKTPLHSKQKTLEDGEIYYKIFDKIEFNNLCNDVKKIDENNKYVLEF